MRNINAISPNNQQQNITSYIPSVTPANQKYTKHSVKSKVIRTKRGKTFTISTHSITHDEQCSNQDSNKYLYTLIISVMSCTYYTYIRCYAGGSFSLLYDLFCQTTHHFQNIYFFFNIYFYILVIISMYHAPEQHVPTDTNNSTGLHIYNMYVCSIKHI